MAAAPDAPYRYRPLTRWALSRFRLPTHPNAPPRYAYRAYRLSEDPTVRRGQPVALLLPEPGGCRVLVGTEELRFPSLRQARESLWLYVVI